MSDGRASRPETPDRRAARSSRGAEKHGIAVPVLAPITRRPPVSPFLALPASTWVAHDAHAFATRDGYPVTPGHTLVITRRLVPDGFSATLEEQRAIFALVEIVKRQLDDSEPRHAGDDAGESVGGTVA